MKVLVTGCAGFVGSHLLKRLLAEGHEVVGVDDLNDYYSPTLKADRLKQLGIITSDMLSNIAQNGNFTFIKSGIEEQTLFDDVLKDFHFDKICHLAAQAGVRYSLEQPHRYITSNLIGFFNVIEYCRKNPQARLVYASSSSVYGKNTQMPYKESDRVDSPLSLYAATKKSDELMAHAYSELYGIETIGLRLFTVYGAWGRPDMAPFLFTDAIFKNETIKLFNKGKLERDFTYIDDIVEGLYLTLFNLPTTTKSQSKRFRIYNVGNSTPVNIEDFIQTIEDLTGLKAKRDYLPMQQGDVERTWADTTLIRNDYGYQPKTDIKSGLQEFINWYREYYNQ
ncbi:MAG: NAD-dependent epimerase/dehydratase family protein [Bacteroidales bacterium]